MAKTVKLQQLIEKEKHKLEEFQDYSGVYDNYMQEKIQKRIERYDDELKVSQESTDLLKDRLTNQITSFKEAITKVLDIDVSLDKKIRTLFREQGITITSALTAIGMAVNVLVEALLPGGGGAVHKPPPKDEKGAKE